MSFRFEGFAIVSEDGMLADAYGVRPSALVVEADQQFLSDSLDRVDLIVHGRNSYENQAHSLQRRRLIPTRQIKTVAPAENFGYALSWNPAGLPLEKAAETLGVRNGTVAILGGTEIYGLFLRRYDLFHLSRQSGLRLLAGCPCLEWTNTRAATAVGWGSRSHNYRLAIGKTIREGTVFSII